ncbi:MAG: hypothetical protein HY880_04860 [Deltaproteobacteria bacterium]|nr:hypothetical protein [Deltaproteobacteria bacterium]
MEIYAPVESRYFVEGTFIISDAEEFGAYFKYSRVAGVRTIVATLFEYEVFGEETAE